MTDPAPKQHPLNLDKIFTPTFFQEKLAEITKLLKGTQPNIFFFLVRTPEEQGKSWILLVCEHFSEENAYGNYALTEAVTPGANSDNAKLQKDLELLHHNPLTSILSWEELSPESQTHLQTALERSASDDSVV